MKETECIEFKKTTSELNEAMISISAILNKHGRGKTYFGLKNDGTPFSFQINDSTIRDVSRKIFESIKPQIYPEISIESMNGIEVIKVEFNGDEKPYSAFGKYYVRVADEDRELSPSELRKIMIGEEYKENWETKASNDGFADIDMESIKTFIKNGISCRRLPDMDYTAEQLVRKLSLSIDGKLNNAGRMLFSKNNPLTLKLAVFATEHKDTFLDMQTYEGNIFQLIEKGINYVISNIRWGVELDEDNIHRKEIPEVPVSALREAIINSFVHARYDLPINNEICIYSNRISITNPGSFASEYKPEDFANNELNSNLRNKLIAKTLYLCKDVESFGSGLRKIYKLCDDANVAVSYVNSESTFTLEFSRIDRNVVTNVATNVVITDIEKRVLGILQDDGSMSAMQISNIVGKASRTIQRAFKSLQRKGLIKRIGSNKSGYWEVLK